MPKLSTWIEASRPKTLIAGLSPVLIGTSLARAQAPVNVLLFFVSLAFVLAIQIATNFANDYFDFVKGADTKNRVGPRRAVQSGLISQEKIKDGIWNMLIVAGLLATYIALEGGWLIALLALASIACAIFYTGGPKPLAYIGLGEVFVFLFFGLFATCGAYYLQTGILNCVVVIASFAPAAFSIALLTVNNLRDLEQDKKVHKKTLPVRFGRHFGNLEVAFSMLIALLVPIALVCMTKSHHTALLASASVFMSLKPIITLFKTKDSKQIAPMLPRVGKCFTLYTCFFVFGWII